MDKPVSSLFLMIVKKTKKHNLENQGLPEVPLVFPVLFKYIC